MARYYRRLQPLQTTELNYYAFKSYLDVRRHIFLVSVLKIMIGSLYSVYPSISLY